MATVRLDVKTETMLKRLAAQRGQTKSDVIRDAIQQLAQRESDKTALDLLRPFEGVADSGGRQLSRDTGRRFREMVEERRRARRAR